VLERLCSYQARLQFRQASFRQTDRVVVRPAVAAEHDFDLFISVTLAHSNRVPAEGQHDCARISRRTSVVFYHHLLHIVRRLLVARVVRIADLVSFRVEDASDRRAGRALVEAFHRVSVLALCFHASNFSQKRFRVKRVFDQPANQASAVLRRVRKYPRPHLTSSLERAEAVLILPEPPDRL